MNTHSSIRIKKTSLLILFLIFIGAFFRFYNLNWGAPFYFHPDERNIASAVSQLVFPNKMNPHFFAYGSLPIYIIYFTGLISNFFLKCKLSVVSCQLSVVTFEQAIIISRFYSALFSTLLIPLLFLIGKQLKDSKTGLLAALLATLSAGFIQFAHFGTFEMWLTFFGTLLFWFSLKSLKKNKTSYIVAMAIAFGILLATKVSSIALLPLPLVAIFLNKQNIVKNIKGLIVFITGSFIIYIASNPYVFIDSSSFLGSMRYESGVVLNTVNVFYTGGFYHTIPVIFQFSKIYPFLINPLLTLIFIPSFFYILFIGIKNKNIPYLLLTTYYLLLFLSQAFFFAKWTRYMVPTIPFIYLIISITLKDFYTSSEALAKSKSNNLTMKQFNNFFGSRHLPAMQSKALQAGARTILILSILLTSIIFGISYFITAFVMPDTRIAAREFAKNNIQKDAKILSEPYDLGLMPFNYLSQNIKIFNFYEFDNNAPQFNGETLSKELQTSDYIILPSQRVLKSRLLIKDKFPKGNGIYSLLTHEALGYQKIYETPCDILCKITYLGDPVFSFEETATVFDRPTVFIFKKIK